MSIWLPNGPDTATPNHWTSAINVHTQNGKYPYGTSLAASLRKRSLVHAHLILLFGLLCITHRSPICSLRNVLVSIILEAISLICHLLSISYPRSIMFNIMHPHACYQAGGPRSPEHDRAFLAHTIMLCRLRCSLRAFSLQIANGRMPQTEYREIAIDNIMTEVVSN